MSRVRDDAVLPRECVSLTGSHDKYGKCDGTYPEMDKSFVKVMNSMTCNFRNKSPTKLYIFLIN